MNITPFIAASFFLQLFACAFEPHAQERQSKDRSTENNREDLSGTIVGDLMAELRLKKVNISRWGDISKNFDKLKIGMPQDEVEKLLGKRDVYPKDRPSVWQYYPSEFRGRQEGDWNLVIHMKGKKISGFQLLKYVYGPPPG